ncbi:MAG: ABC transporter, permease protein 1 (cluster 5, nickel/peptides/opines) [uncultured Thermomicrobiales bacterium]|uniref:ABC transporter, permease protein 1 (Cluster 5, nickel/peptides/opines) n=1 Tax=uncultured Thermomicrobiales bacterium TaxID=1645740 RepID=A0A6J4UL64_9BACT|nr:MAG: ABC transporter, permease protein 1 (cluster 5, nickel/peptides/opines) [uncultured Thermomicrobiales bacterium]
MVRRLAHSVFVLLGLVVVVFFVTHSLGDPARLMLRPEATEEQVQALRDTLGLNDPILVQFGRYMANLARGDFGESIWQRVPALPIVLDRVPATLYLAGVTLAVSLPLAVFLGVVSAVRPRSLADRVVTVVSLTGVSTADFWLGLMLILLFAVRLEWLPTSGFGGLQFVVLPAIALAFRPMGRVSQVVRSSMLDEMGKGYVTTARAKGLGERVVILFHTLKNAAIPIITLAGDEAAALLNGAVVIETLFGWPGVGILLIQAIERRDLPLIEASVIAIAVMIVTVNLVVDLIYARIDARVQYR